MGCCCSELAETFKSSLLTLYLGKLSRGVSRALLPLTGFMAGLNAWKRRWACTKALFLTKTFRPIGLVRAGIGSGWEQSSSNRTCRCLWDSGTEEEASSLSCMAGVHFRLLARFLYLLGHVPCKFQP